MSSYLPRGVSLPQPELHQRPARAGDVIRLEFLGVAPMQAEVKAVLPNELRVRVVGEVHDRVIMRGWAMWRLWEERTRHARTEVG